MPIKDDDPRLLRSRAVEACCAKFSGQRLDFKRFDCIRLVRLALVKQRVPVTLLKGLKWGSRKGAEAAFAQTGFGSLADGMDATGLARIAPAAAWRGDILAFQTPDEDPFGCSLMVQIDNGRVLGLNGRGRFGQLEPNLEYAIAAWRVARG